MRDDFESRFWAENHHRTSEAIARLIEKTAYAFQRLAARQYDAPWRQPAARRLADCK